MITQGVTSSIKSNFEDFPINKKKSSSHQSSSRKTTLSFIANNQLLKNSFFLNSYIVVPI